MSTKDETGQGAMFAAEGKAPRYDADTDGHTFELDPIRGFPELRWAGKRPFRSIPYYPAQLRESYPGLNDSPHNEVYWGDNLQVMSHLLQRFRGKVKLVYIDPPFDSKADYKRTIKTRGGKATTDQGIFEEKQYSDIWTNDEYLQFMYERLVLMRELLADNGTIYLHCDWHRGHHLRCLMDEVFGPSNFINEVVWCYQGIGGRASPSFQRKHDTLLVYQRADKADRVFNIQRQSLSKSTIKRYSPYFDGNGQITYRQLRDSNPGVFAKLKGVRDLDEVWLDKASGAPLNDWWTDISPIKRGFNEATGYPTQKPEGLLERVITASSNEGDIVFDCFMGSGTTPAVAMRLGRQFIGTDINLNAVQTTVRRLLSQSGASEDAAPPLDVFTVNNYEVFRNPVQAKDLLIEALQVQPLHGGGIFDGEKDGRLVKIMPVNRIATRQDLNELITSFNYKLFEKRKQEAPNQPVERILIVCMGHEPDLKAHLLQEVPYKLDVEVVDILRDRADLEFKRESEARVEVVDGEVVVEAFYPLALLQKLSVMKEDVGEWRELVDSILVDFNYDGVVMQPSVLDVPGEDEVVSGRYAIPEDAGTVRVRITDLLSESWEGEVPNG